MDDTLNIRFFLEDGCGIFALAMSEIHPGSRIIILSDDSAKPWGREGINFNVGYAFIQTTDRKYMDASGVTTLPLIIGRLQIYRPNVSLRGPFTPEEFKAKFFGKNKPFMITDTMLNDVLGFIKSNFEKYAPRVYNSFFDANDILSMSKTELGNYLPKFAKVASPKARRLFNNVIQRLTQNPKIKAAPSEAKNLVSHVAKHLFVVNYLRAPTDEMADKAFTVAVEYIDFV